MSERPDLPNVSLNALRFVDAAARHGSFTAAAAELHVTQAAVSQQIRTLEDQLCIKLFVRGSKGLVPTPAGADLSSAARSALATIGASLSRIVGTPDDAVLTVSTLPSFASRWLVPRLGAFRRAWPRVEVRLHTSAARVDMSSTRIDAAIRLAAVDEPGLVTIALMPDAICLVATPALATRLGDDVSSLYAHALAVDNAGLLDAPTTDLTSAATERAIDALGLDRDRLQRLVFSTSEHVIQSALTGEVVALTRVSLCVDDLDAGRLVCVLGFTAPLEHGTSLVYPEARSRDTDLNVFRDWIVAEAETFSVRLAAYLP